MRSVPLRWRLTLWYLLTFSFILLLFAMFLYFQLRANLTEQLDSALELVATQTAITPDGGQLAFLDKGTMQDLDFIVFLTAADGTLWDRAGGNFNVPPLQPVQPGTKEMLVGDDRWRVYSQEMNAGEVAGYIQVVGDMDPISDTLERLLALMLVAGPLALILAGIGGYFLASRALQPIDRMAQTAQLISASDLTQRIHYNGPQDEVGRLAATFDAMLDRLQAAFVRERRFTGDAAHELRTPLAAMKGRIGVTLSRLRQPEAYQETLTDLEKQVDRLTRLSNDLLFMARLDQGQMAGHIERIDVPDFLGAVLEQIRPVAAAKSITLVEEIPGNLTVTGDLDLLIRLFLNLLDNAVKYTPANGRVTFEARAGAQHIQFSISDTGPGIAPKHLPYLFDRFYRVEDDRPRNRQEGGTGLGLAIAYEIVQAHSGKLNVQSQLGQGTTFVVNLPDSP